MIGVFKQKGILLILLIFHSRFTIGQSLATYDEFDGTNLNTTFWNTQQSFGPNINTDNDKQIFRSQNVALDAGKLKLFLKEEPGCYDTWRFCDSADCHSDCSKKYLDPACNSPARCQVSGSHCFCLVPKHFQYTAGMIVSAEKFHYGIFEIKCKIPKDCQSAFWLYGDCCSEIDVFEFLGCEEDKASITIHKCPAKDCHNTNLQCGQNFKGFKNSPKTDFSKDFHTWKLDWKAEGISIYVDEQLIFHCKANGLGACLYNTFNLTGGSCTIGTHTLYPNGEMNLILNIATNPNDCLPPTPSEMEIEYVKVWQY